MHVQGLDGLHNITFLNKMKIDALSLDSQAKWSHCGYIECTHKSAKLAKMVASVSEGQIFCTRTWGFKVLLLKGYRKIEFIQYTAYSTN